MNEKIEKTMIKMQFLYFVEFFWKLLIDDNLPKSAIKKGRSSCSLKILKKTYAWLTILTKN